MASRLFIFTVSVQVLMWFFCVVFFWFCPVVRYPEPVCSVSSISLFSINDMLFLAAAFVVWLLLPGVVYIVCWVALRDQYMTPNCSLFLMRGFRGNAVTGASAETT